MVYIILPNQLFNFNMNNDIILYVSPKFFQKWFNPIKLAYNYNCLIEYCKNNDITIFDPFKIINKFYDKQINDLSTIKDIICFEPKDNTIKKELLDEFNNAGHKKTINFVDNPNFLLQEEEIDKIKVKTHNAFYKYVRNKYNILMKNNKPVYNKYSFDENNRQPFKEEAISSCLIDYKPIKNTSEWLKYLKTNKLIDNYENNHSIDFSNNNYDISFYTPYKKKDIEKFN